MLISEQARLLFIHVPKTGGMSVTALLRRHLDDVRRMEWVRGGRHATLATVLQVRPQYEPFFVFGFVRNPWARLLSWHHMALRRQAEGRGGENPFWDVVAERFPDFESFVMRGSRQLARVGMPQLDYLRAPGRRADFVGRTETLAEDLASIAGHLGLPEGSVVPSRNRGVPVDYRDHYSEAMRDRVAELYAPDITEFGYTF